jgi:mannose-6-phosphate isomerase-like protein (cupin superfamily)
MPVVLPTTEWSAPVTLTRDEWWFAVSGELAITHDDPPEDLSGVRIPAGLGHALASGDVVRYRLTSGLGGVFTREPRAA